MSTSSSPASARWAILVIFLLHGVLLGAWVTQIPLAKARLETGLGMFGIVLLSFAAGAVLAMPLAGVAINRFGSARLTWIMGLSFCVCLFGPSFAPSLPLFMLSGLALGASVVGLVAHGASLSGSLSDLSRSSGGASTERSDRSAAATRDFTVPRGRPSSVAISLEERPSK